MTTTAVLVNDENSERWRNGAAAAAAATASARPATKRIQMPFEADATRSHVIF